MANTFTAAAPRLTGLTSRTFGIELEIGFKSASGTPVPFSTVKAKVMADLAAAGVDVRDESATYNHVTRTWWKFVTDCSIGYENIELVSPILSGAPALAEIEKISAVLVANNVFVNKSMGFHVHQEARDLDLAACKRLARLVTRFKSVFDGLLPLSRRENPMCRHFDSMDLSRIDAATFKRAKESDLATSDSHRYRALNFASISRHGTVEFRQHSGTFDADKIIAWVLLTQGLVEKAKVFGREKARVEAVAATGDGLNMLLRTAGLRTCLPWGQKIAPEVESRVRSAVATLRERAKKFGLIRLGERSEVRSRARRATAGSASEAVAAAVAPVAPVATTGEAGAAQ